MTNAQEYYTRLNQTVRASLGKELCDLQANYTKIEKAAWGKFEAVRDAKYEGKGSREIKRQAVEAAKEVLQKELAELDDQYATAHRELTK